MAVDIEYTMTVSVYDDSPVEIKADGADTECPAVKASDVGALTAGDRVTVLVRNPLRPMIIAIEVEV